MFRLRLPKSLLFLVTLLVTPLLAWQLAPGRPLAVLVVDKTVPDARYREHRAFFWLLDHFKVVQPKSGKPYDATRDYVGFHPLPQHRYRSEPIPMPGPAARPALIYVTDTYGVYAQEFYRGNPQGAHSAKIDGGLTARDVAALAAHQRAGATLVAEFNTFADPTRQPERAQISRMLGVRWSGWIGRYVADLALAGEVPDWFRRDWARQHRKPYTAAGPGFMFVHESGRTELLDRKRDLGARFFRLYFSPEARRAYGTVESIAYPYWFDIVTAEPGAAVLAEYRFDATAPAAAMLKAAGIPLRFPAVVRTRGPGGAGTYYFAGDFVDTEELPPLYRLWGLDALNFFLSPDVEGPPQGFFWKAYVPLMRQILAESQRR